MILEDMDLDGVDVQVMHPNLSLFGLYSDDHELSMAHARVYNDYIIERFSPYFSRLAPTAPVPITDIDDAVAEIERVAAPVPRDPPAGDPAEALLLARPRPGVGGDPGERRARVLPHPDRWREGERPRSTTLKVVMESAAQVNQPMTEKSASKRMITQCVYSTMVPAAGHLRAHRRRCARALPRPPLRPDRVQRPLAGVVGRRWTSAGSPASARTPTGGSGTGTTPVRPTTSPTWRSCSA